MTTKQEREYKKAWYYKNRDKRLRQIKDWQRKRFAQVGEHLRFLKLQRGCKQCGYKKSAWALDFHHKDETKKSFTISQRHVSMPLDKVLKEADKCDIVCKNCHAEIHERDKKD